MFRYIITWINLLFNATIELRENNIVKSRDKK